MTGVQTCALPICLERVEIDTSRERGLCCGAGGARYFMEEDPDQRVNKLRIGELLANGPGSVASACPFCMTMLSDGLKDLDKYDDVGQLDVAEILAISCGVGERKLLRERSDDAAPAEDAEARPEA